MPLRLIFMGTPDFAVPTLLTLADHGHEIAAVYTRAPKPAGRGMKLQPTPVEQAARQLGIPVLTPKTLRTPDAEAEFRSHNADAAVVVAYGMILPQNILDAVPLGCFNLHGSLLPRWRGAAPIQRAIMTGDAESGVMVMKMDAGLDTGDVAMAERLPITDTMTAQDLHDALAPLGADLMVRAMGGLSRGGLQLTKQSGDGVTYAAKIDKAEASTGPNPRARCCGIFTACRRFPARGSKSSSTASRCASRCCAVNWPRARVRRAICWTTSSPLPAVTVLSLIHI